MCLYLSWNNVNRINLVQLELDLRNWRSLLSFVLLLLLSSLNAFSFLSIFIRWTACCGANETSALLIILAELKAIKRTEGEEKVVLWACEVQSAIAKEHLRNGLEA